MGKKLLTLVGIGAGVALVRREIKENPAGPVAKTVTAVTTNPTVVQATENTKRKAGEIIRKQGEVVTDKVADMVKERIFGVPIATDPTPGGTSTGQPAADASSAVGTVLDPAVLAAHTTVLNEQGKPIPATVTTTDTGVVVSLEKTTPPLSAKASAQAANWWQQIKKWRQGNVKVENTRENTTADNAEKITEKNVLEPEAGQSGE